MSIFSKYVKSITPLGWGLILCNVTVLLATLLYFINPNRTSQLLPTPSNEKPGHFQIKISERIEQWDNSNIQAEPRLNFILEGTKDNLNEGTIDNGIYSLRLDGSDFRRVLNFDQINHLAAENIDAASDLKRSASNRYIAFIYIEEKQNSVWLALLDLATDQMSKVDDLEIVNQFYWDENDSLVYYSKDKQLIAFDVSNNHKQNISSRFRLPEQVLKLEFYKGQNRIGLYGPNGLSIYNFNSGGLLHRYDVHHQWSYLASNSLYRYRYSFVGGDNHDQGQVVYSLQGGYQGNYLFPVSINFNEPLVEFGPNYIYQLSAAGIDYFSQKQNVKSQWTFGDSISVRNLSLSHFKPKNYLGIYCGKDTFRFMSDTDHFFDFCGSKHQWEFERPIGGKLP